MNDTNIKVKAIKPIEENREGDVHGLWLIIDRAC